MPVVHLHTVLREWRIDAHPLADCSLKYLLLMFYEAFKRFYTAMQSDTYGLGARELVY